MRYAHDLPRLARVGQSRALSDDIRRSRISQNFRYRGLSPTSDRTIVTTTNTMATTAPQIEQVPIEDFDKVFTASYIGNSSALDYLSPD